MAKVTAPLLSLDAKGTLAKKMTFQNRKGTNTVYWNKGHSDNPSEASETQRTWFREATQAWNELTDEQKQTYKDRAKAIKNENQNTETIMQYDNISTGKKLPKK